MLEALSNSQLVIVFFIILSAYIVRGITGFGSGLIAIPLLALMLPISLVVPMVGLLDYSASLGHVVKLRKDIQWRHISVLLPFSLLGVLLAMYLFNTIDAHLLKKFLGGFILFYALYTLLSIKTHSYKSYFWAIPSGLLGAFIGTLFGTGGPFYIIYLQLQGLGKTAFRATIAIIFLLDGSVRITAYGFNGFYTEKLLLVLSICFPIMLIAMYIGGHIHTNISHKKIQKIIAIILLFSGSALLFY